MNTDEEFRILIGSVTTLYAVYRRKVQGINARSFKAAKERLITFSAAVQPWAVRGPAGDRRWDRGPIHEAGAFAGRPQDGDVGGMGRRGGGVRSELPKGRTCPSCGKAAKAVFKTRNGPACPSCAGRRPGSAAVEKPEVSPEAVEMLTE